MTERERFEAWTEETLARAIRRGWLDDPSAYRAEISSHDLTLLARAAARVALSPPTKETP